MVRPVLPLTRGDDLRCPVCNSPIPWACFNAARPFDCPSCREAVRVPRSSHVNRTVAGFLVSTVISAYAASSVGMFLLLSAIVYLPTVALLSYLAPFIIGFPLEAVPRGISRELGE
jgi:uncharacterized protein (DUF983 family)